MVHPKTRSNPTSLAAERDQVFVSVAIAFDAMKSVFQQAALQVLLEPLGPNAIVATRFTTSVMMGGAAKLLAVGTAVVIENE